MKHVSAFIAFFLVAILVARAATPAENYENHCANCHGKDGKGKTTMGRKSGAKDLTDKAYQAKFSDEQTFKDIKEGMKNSKGVEIMDAFAGKLSDKEIKELVTHSRKFAK